MMSVQQTGPSLTRKETITFAVFIGVGAFAVALGLALIVFAHYHERAYIFLILGAGGLIGGLAGMIVVGKKVRVVLDYGLVAMGCVATLVGLNYMIGVYGTRPGLVRGLPVIALSAIAILIGILREMVIQSNNRFAGFWSVIALGVTGSVGIALSIAGWVYLATQKFPGGALLLLALGAACLVGGIIGGIFAQRRASIIGG